MRTTPKQNSWEDTALSSTVTVAHYCELESSRDKEALAAFIEQRLSERYIYPLQALSCDETHGFLIMAVCCLLIETLEAFYQGWESTEGRVQRRDIPDPHKPSDAKRTTVSRGELAFSFFFRRHTAFAPLWPHVAAFYSNVRCGILHQGETKAGWRVHRAGSLFDPGQQPTINASLFFAAVVQAVKSYRRELENAPWEYTIWENFRNKMKATVERCKTS